VGTIKEWAGKVKVILLALLSGIAFILWYGWKQRAAGKQLGKAEAEVKHAREEYDDALDRLEQQVEEEDVDGLREDLLSWRDGD